ncbi:hypothetical protein LEP1GSC173_1772 [Leptospira interrogans str. HAI1594]|uniref:Uncharacterized protein n=1 Tax=Leptospira interrogans serovar Hardjo str. Norma TaxID=1279460 RepID=A0A0M3TLM0_LEPIR|nr:hypothetical protein G436_2138 [Leptospira interrogans serovar Hardjo str. Norma]EKP75772.1 hypothetical protein LEP1GSC173_1772 [Leptospira interrogans str. HAI1594]
MGNHTIFNIVQKFINCSEKLKMWELPQITILQMNFESVGTYT